MRKIRSHKQLISFLRKKRIESGLSQKDLAEEAGLNQQSVARIETGLVNPTLLTAFKIISALDLELTVDPRRKGR